MLYIGAISLYGRPPPPSGDPFFEVEGNKESPHPVRMWVVQLALHRQVLGDRPEDDMVAKVDEWVNTRRPRCRDNFKDWIYNTRMCNH